MSVISSLRREVYGVPPYKGEAGRQWMIEQRNSRKSILASAKITRKREAQKKAAQRKRREQIQRRQAVS